MQAAGRN